MRHLIPWILLCPELGGLQSLFKFSCSKSIDNRDAKSFPFARPIAQVIRLADVFATYFLFSDVAITTCQGGVGRGEIWITLDSTLEEWDSFQVTLFRSDLHTQRVGLEGFEGWRGGLLEGHIKSLDRAERLTHFAP